MILTFQAFLLLAALLEGESPMNNPKRSDTPVDELQRSLEDPVDRNDALYFIRDFPEDARLVLPTLVKLLQNLDAATNQDHLASCLGAAGEPAVPHLIDALRHRNRSIRVCAAVALRKIGPDARASVPALIERFADDDIGVAQYVFEAVADIGPEAKEAVGALIKVVKDRSAGRRRAFAAYALEHIGPAAKDAVPALVSVVRDEKGADDEMSDTRWYCICALRAIGPDAAPAVPALVAILKQKTGIDPSGFSLEQAGATQALGSIGVKSKEVIAALTDRLRCLYPPGRVDAAEALWRLDPGNQPALELLIRELKNEDEQVRGQAALTLSACGTLARPALPDLRAMMSKDPNEDNRSFAKLAIEQITATPPQP